MQSFSESMSSPWHRRAWDRVTRVFARTDGAPWSGFSPGWKPMPIDFEGDDESLTQAEIALLR